ncbi:hypothetical protein EDD53_1506 [Pacificibacter maritimus]|uniref:Uncharacterized protein n=1 Tax=Pacificibacter maritimus TaxID=762213 RepID=A0A3N4U9F8_9RHOB|nr:hypothetical protein [Pacificibacter maritimus]RPE67102.1 hypothetical protein EDD53_1506 [Pacificibacter maritimus]
MAYLGAQQLEKRLTRIDVKRRAMAKGAIFSVNHDGLIIARPRRRGPRFPVKGMFLSLLGLMIFKVGLVIVLGASTYGQHVQELAEGSPVERAGAWVMEAGPATLWAAKQVKSFGI